MSEEIPEETRVARLLEDIACKHLSIPTLRVSKSDSLDFHNLSVWCVSARPFWRRSMLGRVLVHTILLSIKPFPDSLSSPAIPT
jgi:hypothetical protein